MNRMTNKFTFLTELASDNFSLNDEFSQPDMNLPDDNAQDSNASTNDIETAEEDMNFQGDIRTVAGACLVFKRQLPDNTYNELWVYNVNKNMQIETRIRKSILAGTEINTENQRSEDGKQMARTYTVGNIQYLDIIGLTQ